MKCSKHPKYKAIYQPRCQCTTCWDIWDIKQKAKTWNIKTDSVRIARK